jgi:FtsH-binding integral membrane protein
VSWLPEILCSIFGVVFDLARRTMLRRKSEAKWFHYSLAIGYYLLPTLLVVSVFISWKITVIAAGWFIVSLMAGAVTETDDLGAW